MIALLTIQYNDSTKNIEIRDMVFSTEWFGPYVFQKEPDSLIAGVGVTALFVPIGIKRSTTWIEIPLAVLAAVLILILANGEPAGIITRAEGFCLLCFFAVFIAYTLFIAKRGGQETEEVNIKPYSLKKSVLFILLGLAGLVGGGRLLVDGAVSLAQMAGISERIIGLTIISIGTSLVQV